MNRVQTLGPTSHPPSGARPRRRPAVPSKPEAAGARRQLLSCRFWKVATHPQELLEAGDQLVAYLTPHAPRPHGGRLIICTLRDLHLPMRYDTGRPLSGSGLARRGRGRLRLRCGRGRRPRLLRLPSAPADLSDKTIGDLDVSRDGLDGSAAAHPQQARKSGDHTPLPVIRDRILTEVDVKQSPAQGP